MRGHIVYTACTKCQKEDLKSCHLIPEKTLYKLLKNQEGVICFKCERGHNNCVIVQELPFEKLINYAIDNISDSYYRGAIFNFAAALESFFTFIIELLLMEHGLTDEEYAGLKKLLRYSERQFGAFCAVYYYRFKERPFSWNTIEDKSIIRNKVVHQGQTPTKDEVYRYGNFSLEHIYKIMTKIINNINPSLMLNLITKQHNDKFKEIPTENTNVITINNSFIILKTLGDNNLEKQIKLKNYSCKFPNEYEKLKNEAATTNKVLDITNDGTLIITEKPSGTMANIKVYYNGPKTVDELINDALKWKKIHKMQDQGFEEGTRVISLIDE